MSQKSQVCGKIPNLEDIGAIKKSRSRVNPRGNGLQGDIGEQMAAEAAVNRLHLHGEFYDAPRSNQQGFDSVYRDSQGNLVIVESKMTNKSGRGALSNTKLSGKQGSVEWIRRNAELMQNPASSQYSPDNAKIGEEILRVGPENIRIVLIHTSPQTFETTCMELKK